MNARDLLNRVDGIMFETDAARAWIEQLLKRARGTLDAARKNRVIEKECREDRDELAMALKALNAAYEQLEICSHAVTRRETLAHDE